MHHLARNLSCVSYFFFTLICLIKPHSRILVILIPRILVILIPELAGRGLNVAGLDDVTLGLLVVVLTSDPPVG